ncbi:FecR domain-containing protein [Gillisia sp. M10.2A]|uniref:FecR domain-containing protein n=1 Tax=Gillisia lutea TaxID=2909668 RepID=A0ABS9EH65_9FLAO|nr:FecR family protein [Gillisia lutea]MCF4102214.1 FecR domain-containing protein [Gillisia lutea]
MMKEEILHIIYKKLTTSLNEEEQNQFQEWVNASQENEDLYKKIELYKTYGKDLHKIDNLDVDKAWLEMLDKRTSKPSGLLLNLVREPKWAALAAVFIGSLILINFLFKNQSSDIQALPTEVSVELGDDHKTEILTQLRTAEIVSEEGKVIAHQRGDTLIYRPELAASSVVAYNTLQVPYGKIFNVKLSDGSFIKLNAGSSLRYPVNFTGQDIRRVTLTGEAYFEVSEDKNHPFIVETQSLSIEVLGTSFNVNSYDEDKDIQVALASGSVKMYTETDIDESIILKPNQKGSFNKSDNSLAVSSAEIWLHSAWINNRLILKQKTFSNIIKKLERKYGVSIQNNYSKLNNEVFTASFDIETLEEVLATFAADTPFKYEISGKNIIISKP